MVHSTVMASVPTESSCLCVTRVNSPCQKVKGHGQQRMLTGLALFDFTLLAENAPNRQIRVVDTKYADTDSKIWWSGSSCDVCFQG